MIKLQLTTKNIPLADDVKRIVREKLSKLDKFLSKLPPDLVKAVVLLKKRTHRSEDDIYVTQMAVYVPKKILHVHQDGYNLEESVNGAVDDIEDQLKKYKEKMK